VAAHFSFFNTIVYNSSLYSSSRLESDILEHEKYTANKSHCWRIIDFEFFLCLFVVQSMFSLYKAIIQNLEFIADSEAEKISDKKAYQFMLLK
jgi:hypothetical protein